jgi:hypothetical protein
MPSHTRYFVRLVTQAEITQWIAAGSFEEAELFAEADFRLNGRKNFKLADEDVRSMHVEDQLQIAGTA